ALAARGMWWLASAEQARGEKLASETSEKDMDRMRDALGKAKRDLSKALELNPRIMPAYSALIHATQFDDDDALAASAIEKAIAVSPQNFYPRAALAYKERPRWGGSYEAMDKIADDAARYVGSNPRLADLKAIALGERAMQPYWAKDYAEALRGFDKALAYGPEWSYLDCARYAAESSGADVRAIELLSQMLRFSPWASEQRRDRAGVLAKTGRDDWAQEDLDVVLRMQPRDKATMHSYASLMMHRKDDEGAERKLKELIAADPDDRWAATSLAWLYIHRMRRLDAASAILDPMLKKEPESGDLWLLRVELLEKSGKDAGMREALESFVRYADPASRDQQAAVPIAKRWLASHPH
ncbi:MAG TPA: tetratricopeptide repeat protein, partial [Rhodanobacteraceae bacterium]|nr:tetratricopeptide repeat protein [Rhodanobacteraceae bacterium]